MSRADNDGILLVNWLIVVVFRRSPIGEMSDTKGVGSKMVKNPQSFVRESPIKNVC